MTDLNFGWNGVLFCLEFGLKYAFKAEFWFFNKFGRMWIIGKRKIVLLCLFNYASCNRCLWLFMSKPH